MAESITFNNATYIIPDVGESNWGQNLTNYFVAIPQGCFQLSGGTMPLTADLNFGSNFGLFAKYYTSVTANPSHAGVVRLANTDSVFWRNAANSGDEGIGVNGGDQFQYSGNGIISSSFGSLTPPSAAASSGVLRLANTETIGWRNFANNANLLLSVDSSNNLLWNGSIIPVSGGSDTFASITVTNTTNQIVLGTTHTVTLSSTAPSASRVYTIPDAGGAANVMLDAGNYTVTGTWTGVTLVTPALGTPASGVLTNCTGTASGLTAGHVTTNANLTGVITSVGNATSIASQTGTGTKFVVDTSPTLVTPILGTPQSGTLTSCTGLPLTTGVTGTLPVGNGGTGQTALSAFVPTIQKFTSGSGTYTTPAGVTWIRVRMVGGGGGGSGSGTVTGTVATAGGNTTFGTTLLVANGGSPGVFGLTGGAGGGAGGSASLGSGPIGFALTGGSGGGGNDSTGTTLNQMGAMGAASPFGGAGGGGQQQVAGSAAAANTGAGGGGGGCNSTANSTNGTGGGAGGYVDAIITGPSATYSYAVGGSGTAGGAGTNGTAGGAGGSGLIVVEEHYI